MLCYSYCQTIQKQYTSGLKHIWKCFTFAITIYTVQSHMHIISSWTYRYNRYWVSTKCIIPKWGNTKCVLSSWGLYRFVLAGTIHGVLIQYNMFWSKMIQYRLCTGPIHSCTESEQACTDSVQHVLTQYTNAFNK